VPVGISRELAARVSGAERKASPGHLSLLLDRADEILAG
jgi:hypothetical protein